MASVPLFWVGPPDADSSTEYVIDSDEATINSFVTITTQAATSPYAAATTTLSGALTISGTSITLADGTNFANGDHALFDKELIQLAGKAGSIPHTYAGITRAVSPTIAAAHDSGITVYKAHETYVASVTFATGPPVRHLIVFRITRKQGSSLAAPLEIFAFNPTAPVSAFHSTLFGVERDIQGNRKTGKSIKAVLSAFDNYNPASGERYYVEDETTTTNDEGYWELQVPRDPFRSGGATLTLTIDAGGTNEESFEMTIPDQPYVYFFNAD